MFGPRFPTLPSALAPEDPDAHRELQALADLRAEDKAAYEGLQEFGSISRAREDMDYDAMEAEDTSTYWLDGRVW